MESDWKDLNDNQKIKFLQNGKIVVIANKNYEKTTLPLFCKVCEFPMKTKEDGISFRKVGCCERCDLRWSNTPGVDWENNLWPDKSTELWKEYYNERLIFSKPIINLK